MPTSPTQEQIDKLPRWARDHIRNLEHAAVQATRKYQEQFDSQEKTGILFGDVYDNPRYLPEAGYNRVRFEFGGLDRNWIDFRRSDRWEDGIEIQASSGIVLAPQVSNTILVKLENPR